MATGGLGGHPSEGGGEVELEFLAGDDGVEEAVLEEEFAALEAFGELLADGLLDDAGAGEADECSGFGYVEVAEHGEAFGGDAAGRWDYGHRDGDVRGCRRRSRRARPAEILAKLHEWRRCPPSCGCRRMRGDDDERVTGREGAVYSAGDGLADDGAPSSRRMKASIP